MLNTIGREYNWTRKYCPQMIEFIAAVIVSVSASKAPMALLQNSNSEYFAPSFINYEVSNEFLLTFKYSI